MTTKRREKNDVSITASVSADEMRVGVPARVRVSFDGDGEVVTRRVGLPPDGARAGETYRNIAVNTEITARLNVAEPSKKKKKRS